MKISLQNFKNHSDLSLEIPDKGLVRISGRSGTGKSSVLQAVNFALNNKAKNIVAWGSKTSSVSLEAFNLNLKRTKSPNTLECNGLNSTTAQELIEATIGMTPLEFEISSYVSQGQRNSLINLSPAEQLELINALSFRDKNPEEYKDKIKNFISEHEQNIDIYSRQYSQIKERVTGIENNISSLKSVLSKPETDLETILECLINLEDRKTEVSKAILILKKESNDLNDSLKSDNRSKLDEAKGFIKNNQDRLADLQNQCRLSENQNIVFDKIQFSSKTEKLNSELQTLNKERSKLQMIEKNSIESHYLESILQKNLSKINDNVQSGLDSSDAELSEKLLTLKINSESALSVIDSLKIAIDQNAKTDLKNKISILDQKIQQTYKEIELLTLEADKIIKHNLRVQLLVEQVTDLNKRLELAKRIIAENIQQNSTEEINARLAEIKIQGNTLISDLQNIQHEQSNLKMKQIAHEQYESTLGKISILNKNLLSVKGELSEIENKLEHSKKMFIDGQKLESLWSKAALDVIESTVAEINFRAAYWLDILLEGKVGAELLTTKKIKSRDQTVDSINLQVTYQGQILDKISEELSGGQYSRVVLAFQLALSDLYNSPILMLDEAARGCDLETIEIMLEALKTIADRKLVIMVEHNIPSDAFDFEVELE